MNTGSGEKIQVKLTRSLIGANPNQRKTAKALGLRKLGSSREHTLNPVIQGMIKKIEHLVTVSNIS